MVLDYAKCVKERMKLHATFSMVVPFAKVVWIDVLQNLKLIGFFEDRTLEGVMQNLIYNQ